jgi:preprotein translocase subunit SecY
MSGADGLFKIPELRKKILFTLVALAVYRLGVHIPTPGVNSEALARFFAKQQGTIFGWFNMFSGGALERFSVMALGVTPYISASIIFQLLTVVSPYMAQLQKEGESGQKKINQYTRYATALLCLVQGYGIAVGLENLPGNVVLNPGMSFRLMSMVTLLGGTMLVMWMGEQITERGIGNGTSLIIFAGIAAHIPPGIGNAWSLFRAGEMSFMKLLMLAAIIFGTFFLIIFMERGQRRIPIQYAKRVVGRKMYGGQSTHLPLKINSSGVIPPIFASSLIMLPATLAAVIQNPVMQKISETMRPGGVMYDVLFVAMIVFFAFFYTAVTFKTEDVADNLRKHGAFIPGIRPGPKTAEYIDFVIVRITVLGAVYLSAICILPTLLGSSMNVPFYIGGTSILILIGVAMDTLAQIESHLLSRNYDTFMGNMRMRGRKAT